MTLGGIDGGGGLRVAVFSGAFPVLPGKLDAMRAFAEETLGAHEITGIDLTKPPEGLPEVILDWNARAKRSTTTRP